MVCNLKRDLKLSKITQKTKVLLVTRETTGFRDYGNSSLQKDTKNYFSSLLEPNTSNSSYKWDKFQLRLKDGLRQSFPKSKFRIEKNLLYLPLKSICH